MDWINVVMVLVLATCQQPFVNVCMKYEL